MPLALLAALALAQLPPDIQPDAPQVCSGESLRLDAGPGYLAYEWSTGEQTRSIFVTPLATTTYSVTVADASGTGSAAETVTVLPGIPPFTIQPTPSVLCADPARATSVQLRGPEEPWPGAWSYTWSCTAGTISAGSGPETTLTLPAGFAGSVDCTLTVVDGSGCTASENMTVTILPSPEVTLGPDLRVCAGSVVRIEALVGAAAWPVAAAWTATGGVLIPDPTGTSVLADVTGPGTVAVQVTDAAGCVGSAALVIETLPPPAPVPLGNLLRGARAGEDVLLSWSGAPPAARWEVAVSADRTAFPGPPTLVAPELDGYTDAGAVRLPGSRYYRVAGSDCPLTAGAF